MSDLPVLYKKTSTGAIQIWIVNANGKSVDTTHGQLGGARQIDRVLCEGKNIGRSNETSPERQAELEALSKWEQKVKKGYVQTVEAALAGQVDGEFIAGGVPVMLAQSYSKHAAKIQFPCYVQPKLDGHRCIAVTEDDGTVTLWSRSRKPITGVPHVAKAVEALNLTPGTVLDGELYHHDYRDRFEQLTSFIRQSTPKPGHEVVQYHVYDLPSCAEGFKVRNCQLAQLLRDATDPLVLVRTDVAADAEELTELFVNFTAAGYEGAMARNGDGAYAGKRSYDLQKVKEFEDAEFLVTGVEEGRGRMAGRAIFTCSAPGGKFSVKMKGELTELEKFVRDPSLAVGKLLTVQFQNMTDAGVPRFPVGIRLRETL